MNKIWLVLKNEFISTISRRSFIIILLLAPVASVVVMLVVSYLGNNTGSAVSQALGPSQAQVTDGYVDESGLIKQLPPDVDAAYLIAFASQAQAVQAMQAGKISGYYLVPADYLAKGNVYYTQASYNPLSAFDRADTFRQVLRFNLLGGNIKLLDQFNAPASVQRVDQAPVTAAPARTGQRLDFHPALTRSR